MTMQFSIIVPAYNAEKTLPDLLDSVFKQTDETKFEIFIVDDSSSDSTAQVARDYQCEVIQCPTNRGPASCRNIGTSRAQGEILVFTDSDCQVAPNWLKNLSSCFALNGTDSVMGRLVLLPSTILGDSISALGFPAGGSLGFDKIWRVDEEGFTNSLSSCNFAIKKDVFEKVGGFDESFPYAGGEDSLLAYKLTKFGYRIRYCPDVIAYHAARDSISSFAKWQFKRGISSYLFSQKVQRKIDFIDLRLWSTKNVLRCSCHDKKFPLVVVLLLSSFVLQSAGFMHSKFNRKPV